MLLPVKNSVEWLILTAKTRIQLLEAGLKRGPLSVRNLTPGFGRVGESGGKNDSPAEEVSHGKSSVVGRPLWLVDLCG
jgi:hypothetical protein